MNRVRVGTHRLDRYADQGSIERLDGDPLIGRDGQPLT
jgi:hypothetical protein